MLVLALLVLIFAAVAAYGFTALIILVARGTAHTAMASPAPRGPVNLKAADCLRG